MPRGMLRAELRPAYARLPLVTLVQKDSLGPEMIVSPWTDDSGDLQGHTWGR